MGGFSVVSGERIPIKMWTATIEDGALVQAINLANLPFAFKWIAIMPDVHQGYGMPIGGVLATRDGYVIPNAVGVDIGCGMCAYKTSLKKSDLPEHKLKVIMGKIREAIPVGFDHHKETNWNDIDNFLPRKRKLLDADDDGFYLESFPVLEREIMRAYKQLGTLGGGNHFIEIQYDEDENVWVMIHSGSRNLGYKVAKFYNDLAKELNKRYHSAVPEEHGLAFLHVDTPEGKSYMREMEYCVEFALANRKLMMLRVLEAIGGNIWEQEWEKRLVNIAHNYAAWENHYGQNVIVHRKGATRAREGELGIIPGCQGSQSYIVRGLGCPESFFSCSHGAGRRLSRKKARESLDLAEQIAKLDERGIVHGIRHQKDLDEAPDAYKDISSVMENQTELVEIVHELTPMAVIKG